MLSENYLQRFGGVARVYGQAALPILANTHALIVGIGGVGTWIAEACARMGIGHLTLMDLDDVCITNTNRQIHALQNTIGMDKTQVMAERCRLINPDIKISIIDDFLTAENIDSYINTHMHYDCIFDAIDSVPAKVALINKAHRLKRPLITIGGAGGQIDPTSVSTGDIAKIKGDPLLAKCRGLLRRDYGFSKNPKRRWGIDAVYSTEQLRYPQANGLVSHQKPDQQMAVRLDCQTGFGASVAVTATFGFVAVSRMLQKLLPDALEY